MKKLTISFLAVILSIGAAFSQPVSDFGIIPVGVTLNSILRLNVTSGGNIEYVVNTLDQYTNGFPAQVTGGYVTTFTVASSTNFAVDLYADNANFVGVDNDAGTNTFVVGKLGYYTSYEGGAAVADYTITPAAGSEVSVTNAAVNIVQPNGAAVIAGDIDDNMFAIHWELATANLGVGTPTGLIGIASDRYVVNVFIDLRGL